MFVRTQTNGSRTYLLIVDNQWVEGKVKQRVLFRLGRLDRLPAEGRLDALVQSLARFSEKLAVLGAQARGESVVARSSRIGPALSFQRRWEACSIDQVLERLLHDRRFEFPVERAVFLTVLHRLVSPGSDRAAEKWKDDYTIPGAGALELHQLYRAMAWLGEELPPDQPSGATPFAPRTVKDLLEEELFAQRRDRFSQLDLVFLDTTSIYFAGEGGQSIGQRGHSKDHRPDLKQMVAGVVLDQNGSPVCSELRPGNTADGKSLAPVVERLNVRLRSSTEAKAVAGRAGRYAEVYPQSDDPDDPSPLKVKEVWVQEQRRYVVCVNEDQAAKDRYDREAVVAALREALRQGDKSLLGNRG